MNSTNNWKTICSAKRSAQLASIPKEWIIETFRQTWSADNVLDVPAQCGILNERELEITETTDVDILLRRLCTAEWSSVEVTTAFYKRAVIAHQLTNCLTEIFVERALKWASELDDILAKTGQPVGPLHGLPISLKGMYQTLSKDITPSFHSVDQFTMKGLETVMGYVSWVGKYADSDCVLVELLHECGAVPFVRTNVPQTLMWGETYNHVFGRTLNPYNLKLTPGGSSGGEGALLAMKGSPLGVGTDIGGSLRIPSAFCGLYTLRPSYERLPYCGAVNALEGQESISSVLGPMANSMSGVKLFTKAMIAAKPWTRDPLVIRKEWSEAEYRLDGHGGGRNLCFAMMWDNGVVRPHPPLQRAMNITKAALEAAGHKDGGHDYRVQCELSGEPLITSMLPENETHPSDLSEPYVKTLVGEASHLSAYDLWQLHKEKRELRKSHLDHWERTVSRTGTGRPVDAIISPAVAYTAVPHGLNTDSFYTTLCNALDYSCCVFPVTFVDPKLDVPLAPHEFYNHEDEAIYQFYSTDLFTGCPVGLQLIGRTQEEEAVIAMTEIVDDALKSAREAPSE
ncbi:hypothetical protein H0H92_003982 [Tricholoma furcatifolium]|nr:hypothetical protein H0H92_003982 [Tricholoma furcatifolium]